MGIFTGMTELDVVEAYIEAVYESNSTVYTDEEALSEAFDRMINEMSIDTDDTVAINEFFNDWTDGECKEGNLHETQYSNYCYIGKYS